MYTTRQKLKGLIASSNYSREDKLNEKLMLIGSDFVSKFLNNYLGQLTADQCFCKRLESKL